MEGCFWTLGSQRVTSDTHVMVSDNSDDGELFNEPLRRVYGRAPLSVPEVVWLRSVAFHETQVANKTRRARVPLWLIGETTLPNPQMLSALQLKAEDVSLKKGEQFAVMAKPFTQRLFVVELSQIVELSDVCLVVVGNVKKAIQSLLETCLDLKTAAIPSGFVLRG